MALHQHLEVIETDKKGRAVAFEISGPPTRLAKRRDYDSVVSSQPKIRGDNGRSWDIPAATPAPEVYDRFARLMSFRVPEL